ncbi:MAG: 3-hydroxyacyl-ACP dehydratase FabZ [Vicinamibacteria bacterium]
MTSPVLEFDALRGLVPQGYPFFMIDRVLRIEGDSRVVCLKNVTGNEPHFQGHFPGRAILPGAFILEGMAQAGSVLLHQRYGCDRIVVVSSVKSRFLAKVVPGDQLIIEVDLIRLVRGKGGISRGVATVDGTTVATADIVFGFAD